MSEVRNLERRNSKVFMVYDLDSTNLRYPVQKLIIMSAIHPETGSDDFITAVGSLSNLSECTNSMWCEMGHYDYDGIDYNVYGTVIHPLSVKPESISISIQSNVENVVFSLTPQSSISVGFLAIRGSEEDILDTIPGVESNMLKFCHTYIDRCNNMTLSRGTTRTLITSIPEKYKPVSVRPVVRIGNSNISRGANFTARGCYIVAPMKKTIEVKTFKTAIQEQRLSADDDEIAEWIGDRELVSIDSVVSDNKLIRTVIVKR